MILVIELRHCWSVFEIPQVPFTFEFESEWPNDNSETKQSPNYHLAIQLTFPNLTNCYVTELPFGHLDSNSNGTWGIQNALVGTINSHLNCSIRLYLIWLVTPVVAPGISTQLLPLESRGNPVQYSRRDTVSPHYPWKLTIRSMSVSAKWKSFPGYSMCLMSLCTNTVTIWHRCQWQFCMILAPLTQSSLMQMQYIPSILKVCACSSNLSKYFLLIKLSTRNSAFTKSCFG